MISESNCTGPAGTQREYIWLPEAEIAPTFNSRAQVDRPLAVVEDVETASPVTWLVHVDHLNRPVRMTDAAKAVVWDAVWTPWGMPHAITGAGANNARFPGQWFQLEAGLHYNWHRHYACPGLDPGIRASAATRSPIRSASSMGRVCMGTDGPARRSMSIRMGGSSSSLAQKQLSCLAVGNPMGAVD